MTYYTGTSVRANHDRASVVFWKCIFAKGADRLLFFSPSILSSDHRARRNRSDFFFSQHAYAPTILGIIRRRRRVVYLDGETDETRFYKRTKRINIYIVGTY